MSEDTTEVRAADFDLEGWLAGKKTFTKTVKVTNDPAAGLRLVELEEKLNELEKGKRSGEGKGRAGARAGSAFTPAELAIKDEMRTLLAELDQTWVEVELRPLDPFESNKLADTVKNRMERLAEALALAGTIGGKTKTADFWRKFLKVIGGGQVLKVEETLNRLSTAAVTPDFSGRVSSLLDGKMSSSS